MLGSGRDSNCDGVLSLVERGSIDQVRLLLDVGSDTDTLDLHDHEQWIDGRPVAPVSSRTDAGGHISEELVYTPPAGLVGQDHFRIVVDRGRALLHEVEIEVEVTRNAQRRAVEEAGDEDDETTVGQPRRDLEVIDVDDVADGQLGVVTSSARMDRALHAMAAVAILLLAGGSAMWVMEVLRRQERD